MRQHDECVWVCAEWNLIFLTVSPGNYVLSGYLWSCEWELWLLAQIQNFKGGYESDILVIKTCAVSENLELMWGCELVHWLYNSHASFMQMLQCTRWWNLVHVYWLDRACTRVHVYPKRAYFEMPSLVSIGDKIYTNYQAVTVLFYNTWAKGLLSVSNQPMVWSTYWGCK